MMLTMEALQDGRTEGLTLLGTLHSLGKAPAHALGIRKRITIPGAGSYRKEFKAPLYSRKVMAKWAEENAPEGGFSSQKCLGVVARRKGEAIGYVERRMGAHTVALAVQDPAHFSGAFWRVRGFIPTQDSYVAVAAQRVGFWVVLSLAALATFGLTYLFLVAGWAGWGMLLDTLAELPRTLSDLWYGMLHAQGVV